MERRLNRRGSELGGAGILDIDAEGGGNVNQANASSVLLNEYRVFLRLNHRIFTASDVSDGGVIARGVAGEVICRDFFSWRRRWAALWLMLV